MSMTRSSSNSYNKPRKDVESLTNTINNLLGEMYTNAISESFIINSKNYQQLKYIVNCFDANKKVSSRKEIIKIFCNFCDRVNFDELQLVNNYGQSMEKAKKDFRDSYTKFVFDYVNFISRIYQNDISNNDLCNLYNKINDNFENICKLNNDKNLNTNLRELRLKLAVQFFNFVCECIIKNKALSVSFKDYFILLNQSFLRISKYEQNPSIFQTMQERLDEFNNNLGLEGDEKSKLNNLQNDIKYVLKNLNNDKGNVTDQGKNQTNYYYLKNTKQARKRYNKKITWRKVGRFLFTCGEAFISCFTYGIKYCFNFDLNPFTWIRNKHEQSNSKRRDSNKKHNGNSTVGIQKNLTNLTGVTNKNLKQDIKPSFLSKIFLRFFKKIKKKKLSNNNWKKNKNKLQQFI